MIDMGLQSLELFSGAGGLAIGTHLATFRHAALVEWDHDASATLRANVAAETLPGIAHWRVLRADVREVDFRALGRVDVVVGGPPCQPFSIGGKHRGAADGRDMIPQFARAVREHLPRAFIMENVRGLLRPAFATYFNYTILQLTLPTIAPLPGEEWLDHLHRLEEAHTGGSREPRYQIVWRQVNAADYGVPQQRRRVFVVGFRADVAGEWHFPEPTHSAASLAHEQWVTGAYWERHGLPRPAERPSIPQLPLPDAPSRRPWRTLRDAIGDLPTPLEHLDHPGVFNHRLRTGARAYVGHTGSPLDLPAKALKAGDHGVPGGENMIAYADGSVRYFTAREAARIQTFPDAWRLEGAWTEAMRQMGNAVPVELARIVAASVAEALGRSRGAGISWHGPGTSAATGAYARSGRRPGRVSPAFAVAIRSSRRRGSQWPGGS